MSRITFNSFEIGDEAWAEIHFEGNVLKRNVPRAIGNIVYPTEVMGGGLRKIVVHAWVIKQTRVGLESYMRDLPAALGHELATLSIDGEDYTNCALESISTDGEHYTWAIFTCTFSQSVSED